MLLREIAGQEGPDRLQVSSMPSARGWPKNMAARSPAQRCLSAAALCAALERRGIPVELRPEDDSFKLFACPYLDVAQEHAGVCTMERRMVEQVLGEQIVSGRHHPRGRA